jgi:hypothetical protein
MLFDERPSGDADGISSSLIEAKRQAKFSVYIDRIDTIANVALPSSTTASYVRIQRDGYGSIALAEVEVYAEPLNLMSSYKAGNPVAASTVMEPYQPAHTFSHKFNHVPYDGRWTVVFDLPGDYVPPRDHKGYGFSAGTLAEVAIVVTDLAGVVHTYYQDLKAEIDHLPKYGILSTTDTETSSSYANWRNSFELSTGSVLTTRFGGATTRGVCFGTATSSQNGVQVDGYRYCLDSYGVGMSIHRTYGDTPDQIFIRNEKVVTYKPFNGYLGPDFFTYKIHDGVNVQSHSSGKQANSERNEVTIHVRNCSRFIGDTEYNTDTRITNSLCTCAQTELTSVNDRSSCDTARTAICAISDANNNNTDGTRQRFIAMCQACEDTLGYDDDNCVAETIRAVSLVTVRGLCDADTAAMDCTSETVTKNGIDRWQYLTLKPPSTDNAFSNLGQNLGGAGYYRSSPKA